MSEKNEHPRDLNLEFQKTNVKIRINPAERAETPSSPGRLTTKSVVFATSGIRFSIYHVLKTSDLRRLGDT